MNICTARLVAAIAAGFLLAGLLLPRVGIAADPEVDDVVRFFEKMPAELFQEFAPEAWAEDEAAAVAQSAAPLAGSIVARVLTRQRPAPEYLFSEITDANLDGAPEIYFTITDEFGLGIEGLRQGETVALSFTVSKLVPGSAGKTDNWATYIRVNRAPDGLALGAPDTYANGTLEDLGGGDYRFTFDQDLESIAGVAFEPALTHRVGMEIRSAQVFGQSVPNANTFDTTFDIQPSTGATEGIAKRRIATQEACAACHGVEDFAFHGGARKDVQRCSSCHQRDLVSSTGDSIDFTVMVHKIHAGTDLTEPFELCGFPCRSLGGAPVSFNEVTFPQDTRNCVVCHDPANPETPEADWVANRPTAMVCASCHDQLDFDETGLTNARRGHIGLAQPDSTCAVCHSDEGLMISALEHHEIPGQVLSRRFSYNILEVTNTAEGQSPVVTVSITDPTNNDEPYDLASDPAFTGSATSISLQFSWPNTDFTNVADAAGSTSTGRPVGQPRGILLVGAGPGLPAHVTDNGDGTYTLDTGALADPLVIPSTMPPLGSGTVAFDGRPAADITTFGVFADRVPVTSTSRAFAITDSAPQPRRQVVDTALCQDCHNVADGLSLHGNNRTDNVEQCTMCHNPNATDLFRRPVDPDGVHDGVNMAALDELEDQSVQMAFMIHAIHAAGIRQEPYVAYGFTGAFDFSEVTYPRSPSDCQACHIEGSFALSLPDTNLGVTVNSGATQLGGGQFAPSAAAAADPRDNHRFSPEAAACVACHDSGLAKNHMSGRSDSPFAFGNAFILNPDPINDPDTQDRLDMSPPENCVFCHGPGRFVDIADAHGL